MNVEVDIDLKFITVTRLWYGLHHALPRHPFLWYRLDDDAMLTAREFNPEPPLWQQALLYSALTLLGLLGFLVWASLTFPMEIIVLVTGMVSGGYAAIGIGSLISRERERGRYDLMGLSPSGLLGASWVMATRFLRNSERFDNLRQLVNIVHTIWMIVLVPLLLINFLIVMRADTVQASTFLEGIGGDFSPFVNATILLLVSRADFMYSVVVGAFIGMISPTLARGRSENYSYALVLFVLQQLVIYIGLIVISALVHALMRTFFGSVAWYWLSLSWLVVFFLLREVEVRALCRVLAQRVNVKHDDVMTVSQNSI